MAEDKSTLQDRMDTAVEGTGTMSGGNGKTISKEEALKMIMSDSKKAKIENKLKKVKSGK